MAYWRNVHHQECKKYDDAMWQALTNSDRLYKCCKRQGPPSGKTLKYLEAAPYDC